MMQSNSTDSSKACSKLGAFYGSKSQFIKPLFLTITDKGELKMCA